MTIENNRNNSKNIINIINLDNIDYLKKITDFNMNIWAEIYNIYYNYKLLTRAYVKYNSNVLKILKSLNLELISCILTYKSIQFFTFINSLINKLNLFNIGKNKILQIIKDNNVVAILKKLYNNNQLLNSIIDSSNYYINKISLNILLKNKILKIMNIYGNKLTLPKSNYYYIQLKFLKLKIMDIKLNLIKILINSQLNVKIYNYLLLLLLYTASLTIPLALIAFP